MAGEGKRMDEKEICERPKQGLNSLLTLKFIKAKIEWSLIQAIAM